MRSYLRFRLILWILILLGGLPAAAQAASVAKFATAQAVNWRGGVIDTASLMEFYRRNAFNGIWTDNRGLNGKGRELLSALSVAYRDGLEVLDYLGGFPGDGKGLSGDNLAAAELYLSQAAIRFATHLYSGRTTPSISEPDIVIARKQLDAVALLGSMDKNGPSKVIDRLRPPHAQYQALRKTLAESTDPRQQRKLIVNMERWRWLPRDLGDRHVFVNVATFQMLTRDQGRTVDTRDVIVGEAYHRTPMFSHSMTHSEFNPTWTITPSIAGNEILPKLRKDPAYLAKRGYVLYTSWEADAPAMNASQIDWSSVSARNFPFRIVQPAGPDNALGLVKFLFPNKFNVYLHDTANRELFAREDRALSHGCIRVHRPLEFAEKLYALDGSLTRAQIDRVVASGKTTPAKFRQPIPIHLAYFTAWAGSDGKVRFHNDIYGRDKLVANILFGGI